jgi:hypothetical protein
LLGILPSLHLSSFRPGEQIHRSRNHIIKDNNDKF